MFGEYTEIRFSTKKWQKTGNEEEADKMGRKKRVTEMSKKK